MYQQFYSQSDLLAWPVIALLLFVMIFVGVLAYVFLGLRDKNKIDRMAALPFVAETEWEDRTQTPSGNPPADLSDPLTDAEPDGRTR